MIKRAHTSKNTSKHAKRLKSANVRLKLRQQLDLARDLGRVHEGALARRLAVLVDHVETDRQQRVAVLRECDEARRVARLVKGQHVSACAGRGQRRRRWGRETEVETEGKGGQAVSEKGAWVGAYVERK